MSTQQLKNNTIELVETIKQGQIPSTQMVQNELAPAQNFLKEKEQESATTEKEKALHETRKFLEAFEKLLVEKNVLDRMNRLVDAAKRVSENTEPVNSKAKMWRETRQFVAALNDLVPDLLKSQVFRSSILDLFKVMRDVFNLKAKEHGGQKKLESAFVQGKSVSETVNIVGDETKKAFNELKSGEIPEEQKQRLRSDIKNLISQLNQQSSISCAFQKLLNLWDMLSTELSVQLDRKNVDPDVREVQNAARDLLEAFAGRKVDQFINKLQKANETIQNDQQLQNYLQGFRDYLRRGLENPNLLESDQYINEGDNLIERGKQFADKYYNSETLNDLCDESQELIDAIKTDDLVQNLQCKAQNVADAFTYTDITGTKHLDTDIISQMRADLVPFILNQIKEVPLPPFRLSDENFEFLEITDLKVKLEDVVPDKIRIHSKNDTEITPKDFEAPTTSNTVIKFKMDGIRPEFQDFQFRFKRRGLIGLEDVGRANLKITGDGVSVNLDFDLQFDSEMRAMLVNSRVKTSVDSISMHVIESDHKVLLNMVSTLFSPMVKGELENALKTRFGQMGNEWAGIINKRILSAVPLGKIGSTVQQAITKTVPILGETIIDSSTKKDPIQGTVNKTVIKHNP